MKHKTFSSWWASTGYNEWCALSKKGVAKKAYDAALDSLPKKRSNQQNRYYWGVVCKLASDHTGYTPEEIHDFHKERFLDTSKLLIIGNKTATFFSTKNMTTKQFNEWISDKLIPFWAAQDVYIPLPNEIELWTSLIESKQ